VRNLQQEDRESLDEELRIAHGKLNDCEGKLHEAITLLMKEKIIFRFQDYCFVTKEEPHRIK